jgi:hypothetical protein
MARFITRLGPVSTGEGSCYFFLVLEPTRVVATQVAANDAAGFAQLAPFLQGDVVCDQSLAKPAKKHGVSTGPAPPWAVAPRLSLAMSLVNGSPGADVSPHIWTKGVRAGVSLSRWRAARAEAP